MSELKIKKIVVGQIEANCYLLTSNNELAVVDPGDEYEKIASEIDKLGKIKYRYILLTHGHFDHVGAVKELKEKYGFQIVLCEHEKKIYEDTKGQEEISGFSFSYQGDPDIWVKDGDILEFGSEKIKVMDTPGHTHGSVCYLVNNNLFSGDTLFPQRHGMTSFPTGSQTEMNRSLKRLFSLEDGTKVFPGHYEETTIGEAKKHFRKSGFDI